MPKHPIDTLLDNLDLPNIAENLDENEQQRIASLVKRGYEVDDSSRTEWKKQTEEGIKIAEQVMEVKNYPWPGASNVKFPLIAISAIQFAARAYPNIIQGDKVVKANVIGKDPQGEKSKKASRVSTHMSWQLVDQMEGWDEDTDKLLHVLPVVGTVFRKTFFDELNQVNASELCMPLDVVVHMDTKNFNKCRRVTHIVPLYKNEVLERERSGLFLELEANYFQEDTEEDLAEDFLEQHRWLDLDGDGYEEPYIVTVHEASGEIVRIVARYDATGIKADEKGKILKINPVQYFTPYFFIPSASGKFYAQGFAHLLGGINEALSTTINMLLDAGHMATTGGGFLGRGAKIKGGNLRFKPNEWKQVEVMGGMLKDNIVPLPVKEPSMVLFQLLGLLNDVGMKLASVSDTMAGESPSQNTPATTTLAVLEQGLKVFTAIYKRIFRSLRSEYGKLRRLNSIHLDEEEVFRVLDEETTIFRSDYSLDDYDIIPVADPTMASDAQRLAKAQALMNTIQMNPTPEGKLEIISQFYEALQVPNMDKLLPKNEDGSIKMPQPPPDPEVIELQLKATKQQEDAEIERGLSPLKKTELEEKINLIKAQTANALADAADKPIMLQLKTLSDMVSSIQADTKMDIERHKIKEAADARNAGNTSQGGPGSVPGMGGPPNNGQGAGVPAGMQAGPRDGTGPGGDVLAGQFGTDGAADSAGGGGDPGTRPYPDDVSRG